MTHAGDLSRPEYEAEAKKFFENEDAGLPEALYLLSDGSYGDRRTFDEEQAKSAESGKPALPWGKGALLLNHSTKSYLTPFGFKALFRQRRKLIIESFARAGLDPTENYFQARSPDILIRQANGRFVPTSHLPKEEWLRPLLLRFHEEDIYLQNFNREGTKRTGSYIAYVRAGEELRERHAEALQGIESEEPVAEVAAVAEKSEAPEKRTFKYRPRTRGLTRRRSPSGASKPNA